MAELALGSPLPGNAAGVRQGRRERLRRIPSPGGKAGESVRRMWRSLDDLPDADDIGLVPHEAPPRAGVPVPAIAGGAG